MTWKSPAFAQGTTRAFSLRAIIRTMAGTSWKPADDWNALSCTVPMAPSGEDVPNRGGEGDGFRD
jgi:hypothetical protein